MLGLSSREYLKGDYQICPLHLACGQLKTWATGLKEDLEHLSRQRILGCAR